MVGGMEHQPMVKKRSGTQKDRKVERFVHKLKQVCLHVATD